VSLGAANRPIPAVAAATLQKKSGAKTYPRPVPRSYRSRHPASYRGVSVQHLQTRGGERWPGRGVGDATLVSRPAVQAASSRRAGRAATSGGEASSPEGEAPERSVHRGRCGASLQTPRAGRLGFWRTCGITDFGKPRCREAPGPAGPSTYVCARCASLSAPRTLGVPRALGSFRGRAEGEYGVPRAAKNRGDDARPGAYRASPARAALARSMCDNVRQQIQRRPREGGDPYAAAYREDTTYGSGPCSLPRARPGRQMKRWLKPGNCSGENGKGMNRGRIAAGESRVSYTDVTFSRDNRGP